MNYMHTTDTKCGACGDDNDLKVGIEDHSYDEATMTTALLICGPVCDRYPSCAGFHFEETAGRCYYHKSLKCAMKAEKSSHCFKKEDQEGVIGTPSVAPSIVQASG